LGICVTLHHHALPLLKAGNHIHNFSNDIAEAPYTYTNWWWISLGAKSFTCKNWITPHTFNIRLCCHP